MTGVPQTRITHIGGPTTLLEIGELRLLTDPTFDPPGRRYTFGWGSASHQTTGPAIPAADLLPIDAVLLSHDHHGDNLDDAGRRCCRQPASSSPLVGALQEVGDRSSIR